MRASSLVLHYIIIYAMIFWGFRNHEELPVDQTKEQDEDEAHHHADGDHPLFLRAALPHNVLDSFDRVLRLML